MRVFVSSLIAGYEAERAEARAAIYALGHDAVMAEDLQSQSNSPQVACLSALRTSDVMVLLLAERYGFVANRSTISPTHEEFREARDTKPILVFVKDGERFEPAQQAFVDEVRGWSDGYLYKTYSDPADLQTKVIRALHDHALVNAVAPLDKDDLIERVVALFLPEQQHMVVDPRLDLGITLGPTQQILRPAEIEAPTLAEAVEQQARFGDHRLFERSLGLRVGLDGSDLVLSQQRGASIRVTEQGSFLLQLPLAPSGDVMRGGLPAIIEEGVEESLMLGLGFADWLLQHIDPSQRATHIAVAARVANASHHPWRMRAEHAASPNSMTIDMHGKAKDESVHLVKPRSALRMDRRRIVEDLVVPIRRKFQRG